MLHCASMANVVRPLAFDAGVLPDWATAVGVAQIHGCACEPSSTGPPIGWLVMVSVTSLPSSLPLPLPLSSATRSLRPTTSPVTSPRSVRAAALAVKDEVMSCPFSFTLTAERETCFGTRTSTSASPPLMRSARFESVTISRFEPGVGVAALDRLRKLSQGHLVVAQLREVRPHLVLLDQAAEADDVRDAGHEPQLARHHPVLVGAQLARRVLVALDAVAVDLADRGRERRQLCLHAVWQVDLAQPLDDLLPGEIAVRPVVEGEDEKRKAELRVRKHAHRAGQPRQRDLQRHRDLLLHLLGGAPGVKRDHRDLRVGDVWEGLDREVDERPDSGADEERHPEDDEERLVQRERDDALDQSLSPSTRAGARGGGFRPPPPCRWQRCRRAPPGSRR